MASTSQSKVCFFFDEVAFGLSNRNRLKKFIERIFRKEGLRLQALNYVFCSDRKLLEMNRTYLNHDFFTDIISFDLSEPGAAVTGDIYISIDRVRENASLHGTTLKSEIHRVIFHGALHLCGFKDKTKPQITIMRKKEAAYLANYFR